MAWYLLECHGTPDRDWASLHRIPRYEGVSWNRGVLLGDKVPVPVTLHLDPEAPGHLPPMFHKGVLAMSRAMAEALEACGVDNLELFDAVLVDERTGTRRDDYLVVNVLGAIAAADLGASRHRAHGRPLFDVEFDALVIQEDRPRGALMFRLAENLSGIVVHEQVRRGLEAAGIGPLDFVPPGQWFA